VTSGLYRFSRELQMRARGRRDVDYIGTLTVEHLSVARVLARNAEPGAELARHERLGVANGDDLGAAYGADLLDVSIGDLAASDDNYF
jgi:hypothetical protein